MSIQTKTVALGLACAFVLGTAVSASAGPIPTGTATVKEAAGGQYTDVRWRGRGGGIGPGLAFGLAAGALAGAAIASQPYYGSGYYYDAPVAAAPYGYYEAPVAAVPYGYYDTGYAAPAYYGSGYRRGGCYTDEGYGRRRPCSAN